ncbi:MAG: hypothetical protein Q9183_002938 [Haloplaca sp. 2 TL-2023]
MRLTFASSCFFTLIAYVESMPRIARVMPPRPVDYTLLSHHNYLTHRTAHAAHAMINHQAFHERNVIESPPAQSATASTPALAANASPDDAQNSSTSTWIEQTRAACMKALTALEGEASSPCGLSACYNIQSFDSTTGIFNADLQLYRIAPATGDWASLMGGAVNIGLSYTDASVAPGSPRQKRDQETLLRSSTEPSTLDKSRVRRMSPAAPTMVQEMGFVGQINSNRMKDFNDTVKVHTLLTPRIALTGTDPNGKSVTTMLSSSDASFVNGMFALPGVTSTSGNNDATASAAAKAATFVLPGRTLGIFPVGLIITSVWTMLFVATVGYGTVERIRFREAYRRRIKYRQALNARRLQRSGTIL